MIRLIEQRIKTGSPPVNIALYSIRTSAIAEIIVNKDKTKMILSLKNSHNYLTDYDEEMFNLLIDTITKKSPRNLELFVEVVARSAEIRDIEGFDLETNSVFDFN